MRPRVLAVLRLIISEKRVGCSTGISPGFAPFRTFRPVSSPDERRPAGSAHKRQAALVRRFWPLKIAGRSRSAAG